MIDPILGIDLGTTNSVVAVAEESGAVRVLPDARGFKIQPSVVSFHPNGTVVTGAEAKQRRVIDPKNTIYSSKRLIGRTFDSPEVQAASKRSPFAIAEGKNNQPVFVTRAGRLAVPEISAILLDHMRDLAGGVLGAEITRAVVTVPANFNDAQRAATANAGSIAGLELPQVINEPTAAALAYGHKRNLEGIIAVYDFGGGTFDVTVLELADRVYEVLGTAGNSFLGGDDIDERVVDKMAQRFLEQERIDLRSDDMAMQRLRQVAEQTKVELSRRSRAIVTIDEVAYGPGGKGIDFTIELTREELINHAAEVVDRTFPVCQEALRLARVQASDVADVVLVGGSTKMPYVRQRVAEFFHTTPRTDINPDEAVAMGAALQALALRRMLGPSHGAGTGGRLGSRSGTARPRVAVTTGVGEPALPARRRPTTQPQPFLAALPPAQLASQLATQVKGGSTQVTPPVDPEQAFLDAPTRVADRPIEPDQDQTIPGMLEEPKVEFIDAPTHVPGQNIGPSGEGRTGSIELELPETTDMIRLGQPIRPEAATGHTDNIDLAAPLSRSPGPARRRRAPSERDHMQKSGEIPATTLRGIASTNFLAKNVDTNQIVTRNLDLANTLPRGARPLPQGKPERRTQEQKPPPPPPEPPASQTRPATGDLDFGFSDLQIATGEFDLATTMPRGEQPAEISAAEAQAATTRGLTAAIEELAEAPNVEFDLSALGIGSPAEEERTSTAFRASRADVQSSVRTHGGQPGRQPGGDVELPVPVRPGGVPLGSMSDLPAPVGPSPRAIPPAMPVPQAPPGAPTQALMPEPMLPDRAPPILGMQPAGPAQIPVVLDVVPHSLGIGTVAGYCEELICRNARLPTQIHRVFTTSRDWQRMVLIQVCQGESRRLEQNVLLGHLVLEGLEPRLRGETYIEVTFQVDASGILHVFARDGVTGITQEAYLNAIGAQSSEELAAASNRFREIRG